MVAFVVPFHGGIDVVTDDHMFKVGQLWCDLIDRVMRVFIG